ncbi:hypothetical protein FB451DRAFT_1562328 [Mycena latifolia]|nr:hypothetical protein FB451DRAFT_1562328 [Mycena latifolia]
MLAESAIALSDSHHRCGPSIAIGSQLRSRLVDIERKVTDLESQLARLHLEKAEVLASLDSISIGGGQHLSGVASYSDLNSKALDLFQLSPTRDPARLAQLLQCWFSRAGRLPLTLDIELSSLGSQDAILSILTHYSSQWKTLDLRATRPLSFPVDNVGAHYSSLETLKLNIRDWPHDDNSRMTAFLNAPRLREVSLPRLSLASISLPWAQLTTLELWGQSLGEGFDILAQTQNLETLTISLVSSDEVPPNPCTLPHLRALSLMPGPDLPFLDFLTLPALERLELYEISAEGAVAAKSLFARSRCSLRSLSLSQATLTEAYDCFWTLKSLREVTLRFTEWSTDDFSAFFAWLRSADTLPALEVLNVDRCRNVDVCALADMLSTRSRGVDGAAKLQSFRLSADGDFGAYGDFGASDVRIALRELADLRVEGFKMEIASLPEWATRNISTHMMDEVSMYYDKRDPSRNGIGFEHWT